MSRAIAARMRWRRLITHVVQFCTVLNNRLNCNYRCTKQIVDCVLFLCSRLLVEFVFTGVLLSGRMHRAAH